MKETANFTGRWKETCDHRVPEIYSKSSLLVAGAYTRLGVARNWPDTQERAALPLSLSLFSSRQSRSYSPFFKTFLGCGNIDCSRMRTEGSLVWKKKSNFNESSFSKFFIIDFFDVRVLNDKPKMANIWLADTSKAIGWPYLFSWRRYRQTDEWTQFFREMPVLHWKRSIRWHFNVHGWNKLHKMREHSFFLSFLF